MSGSMRQRSAGSWELRVYVGLDPDTGRRRYRTKTVRGNRADAERELVDFVDRVGHGRNIGGRVTMGELLDRWFALASLSWAPTTVRQTRSIVDRHLRPHIDVLDEANRMPDRQQGDRLPEPDPLGNGCGLDDRQERVGAEPVAREVVLANHEVSNPAASASRI